MNRYHHFIFGVIILCGLILSVLIFPREAELALIRFKDKEFESARKAYERQLAGGDLSVSVVMPLTQLYLQYGAVDSAVSLMEKFVQANPDNKEARERLGKYYQYAQQPDKYLLNLERLAEIDPSEPNLRALSELYNYHSQFDKQVATLKKLIGMHPENPKDFQDLASLQAARGHIAEAALTLEQFETRHPESTTNNTTELLLSLQLDSGQIDQAFQHAAASLAARKEPEVAARFAGLFHFKGRAQMALRLLGPFEKLANDNPVLLKQLVQLQIANGRQDEAFSRLMGLHREHRLPDSVKETLLDQALIRKDIDLAIEAAENTDLTSVPDWLLANLADAAFSDNRADFAFRMIRELGESFLQTRPILGARLALAHGDRESANRWIARVETTGGLSLDDKIALSNLYSRIGRQHDALDLLASVALTQTVPDTVLTDLYFLAMENGAPDLAVAVAQRLYQHRAGRVEGLRLVRALTAVGRPADALPYARSLVPGNQEEESTYVEALSAARKQGHPVDTELRNFWSLQLAHTGVSEERRQEILYALLEVKGYQEALPTLAALARKHPDESWFFAYADAAVRLGRKNELVDFLKVDLERNDLSAATKEVRLRALLENGGDAVALPYLRVTAEREGRDWAFAYEDALGKLGRSDELVAFWKSKLAKPGLNVEEKRRIAFAMLNAGYKPSAEAVFIELARAAPATSPDVSQLLFLWGPRPEPAGLEWIEARARAASGTDRARWIEHLINAGAARRAAEVAFAALSQTGRDPFLVDGFLKAAAEARDGPHFDLIANRELSTEEDPGRLKRFARTAIDLGREEIVKKSYTKVLAAAPHDPDAHRWMGLHAFADGDYSAAQHHLVEFLAVRDDHEAGYYLGEILSRQGNRTAAIVQYRRALNQIERVPQKTPAVQALQAQLLYRIGRFEESFALFQRLLGEQPEDKNLRADFATLLMEHGRYGDARRVMGQP